MAREPIVQRQVSARATPGDPGVSADAFGVGVGRRIEQLGNVVQAESLEDARIERRLTNNAELADFNVAFAAAREEFSEAARKSRKSDQPGHAVQLKEQWAQREGELLSMLSNQALRDRGRASLANWSAGFNDREAAWEAVRQSEIAAERTGEQLRIAGNRVRRLEDPADYAAELQIQLDAIGALDVEDKLRQRLSDEAEERLAIAYLRGVTDRDPEAAKAMLRTDVFDAVLSGDQVEALLNGADVEIRRGQAARDREAAAQRAQLREQLQVFKEAESQGLVETPEAYDAAIAQATAVGDRSLALQLEGLKFDAAFTRIWGPENANSVQRERRLADLAAQGKRSDSENRELAFLRKHSSAWASQEASDPVGLASRRGGQGAPPAIDFNDEASLAARGQWAAARGVAPLTKVEARALGQIYDQGRAGEEQVLAMLGRFPDAQAMRAAAMIDPDDDTLPILATLPPGIQAHARRGREALKANRSLIKDALEADFDLGEAVTAQRLEFDEVLINVPPEQREALKTTADQIMAGYMDRGLGFNAAAFERSLSLALGAEFDGGEQLGGMSRWRGKMFLLPGGWTKEDFKRAALDRAGDAENGPVNPDGSAANVLRADPVPIAPGVYEFHTAPGSPLLTGRGDVWRVEVDPR